ncbi:MAG: sugar phosphate isomerase/epimerase [Pirellulales bacterium]|nr:sugar phosphate isomerase/epimerase [Pirellulales bacterium]
MDRLFTSRRDFLQSSAIAGALLPTSAAKTWAAASAAGPGDHQPFRIGLSQYSLHRTIKAGRLATLDYPMFARTEFGISEIDVWEGTFPKEEAARDRHAVELRKRAEDAESRIFLFMAGVVDGSQPNSDMSEFLPWLDRAKTLGCDFFRVFLRSVDEDSQQAMDWAASAMKKLADQAKQREIAVVIEPGASKLTQQGAWLAKLMTAMDHSHCKLMPDFGKFGPFDIYEGTQAMMPHTQVVSAKSHDFRPDGQEVRFDYPRLIKIATESGFDGIVAIEFEGSRLDEVAGIKATLRLLTQIRDSLPS